MSSDNSSRNAQPPASIEDDRVMDDPASFDLIDYSDDEELENLEKQSKGPPTAKPAEVVNPADIPLPDLGDEDLDEVDAPVEDNMDVPLNYGQIAARASVYGSRDAMKKLTSLPSEQKVNRTRGTVGVVTDLDPSKPTFRFAPKPKNAECQWAINAAFEDAWTHLTDLVPTIRIDTGYRTGNPVIKLRFEVNANGLEEEEKAEVAGRDYGIEFTFTPGLEAFELQEQEQNMAASEKTSGSQKRYQVEDFRLDTFQDIQASQSKEDKATWEILKNCPDYQAMDAEFKPAFTYVTFTTQGGTYVENWSDDRFRLLSNDVRSRLIPLKIQKQKTTHHVIFMSPLYGERLPIKERWTTQVKSWWTHFMHFRWPPYVHLLCMGTDPPIVDVSLDSPKAHVIGNWIYATFEKKTEELLKQKFLKDGKVVFPEDVQGICAQDRRLYWSSEREFEAAYKVATVQEFQFVTRELETLVLKSHNVVAVRPMVAALKNVDTLAMTESQKKLRTHCYIFVWLNRTSKGQSGEIYVPTEGTWLYMDPEGFTSKYQPSKKSAKWYGCVSDYPGQEAKELGADFCVFMSRGERGRSLKTYPSIAAAKRARKDKVRLEVFIDRKTEARHLNALTRFCKQEDPELRHLQVPIFFTREQYILRGKDWRYGPNFTGDVQALTDEHKSNHHAWQTISSSMSTYRDMANNQHFQEMQRSFREHLGPMNIITGAAGTGKTQGFCDQSILLAAVGNRIYIMAEQQDAVDNAAMVWESCHRKALAEHADQPLILQKLEGKRCLRYEANGLPDRDRVTLMAADMCSDGVHVSKGPDPNEYLQDPAVRALIDMFQEKGRFDDAVIKTIEKENQEAEKNARKATVDLLHATEKEYNLFQKRGAKKTLRYPASMSMGYHLRRQIDEDRANPAKGRELDELMGLQKLFEAQTLTEKTGKDRFNEINENRMKRVIQDADIIFMTLASSGENLIRQAPKPDYVYLEEASQISVPSMIMGLQLGSKQTTLVGDPMQMGPIKSSRDYNAFYKNFEISALDYCLAKGFPHQNARVNYRYPYEMAIFVNKTFYPDGIECHPCTEDEAAPARIALRRLAFESYGIERPDTQGMSTTVEGHGALFFMVNVKGGMGVREEGGTSYQNFAEMEEIYAAAKQLVSNGCPVEEIGIAVYYRGQIKAWQQVLEQRDGGGALAGVTINTIDQSQGKTKSVCLVSFVATAGTDVRQFIKDSGVKQDMASRFSAHVKLASRLVVALTRARHGTVVFCHADSLAGPKKVEMTMGRLQANDTSGYPLRALVAHMEGLNLIADTDRLDTNPRFPEIKHAPSQAAFHERVRATAGKGSLKWVHAKKTQIQMRKKTEEQAPKTVGDSKHSTQKVPYHWKKNSARIQESDETVSAIKGKETGKAKKRQKDRQKKKDDPIKKAKTT